MNLTRAAIDKNRITVVVLVVILLSGVLSFFNMSRAEDPGFVIRVAVVVTYFPGASPQRVEQLVTDKIEKAVQQMPELDFVSSESKNGISIVYVNIRGGYREMRPIWDSLRRKVADVSRQLPGGVIGPFVNDEFGDVFGTIVGITGDGFNYAELKDVADEVRDELLLIPEVAKVDVYGDQEERIFIEYNNARLSELGLSPLQLQQILSSRNIIIPGGSVDTSEERISLEPSGNFERLEDVTRALISVPGRTELIALQDIASIARGYVDPPPTKLRVNGEPALALAVSMREGGNIIDLGQQIKDTISRVETEYPIGIDFTFIQFQAGPVNRKVNEFVGNLMQAVSIVVIVMLVSLGIRTGLVVASLVPMAIVMSLMIMGFLGIGLDQMSLASLIIALGMLVDNAIVMSESIMVQMGEGKPAIDAAVDSASELRVPLLISSLTTVVAFLPMYLAESDTGEYVAPLFKVVAITLLSSWILSLTMIPMLCVTFFKVKKRQSETAYGSRFYQTYRRLLLLALRNRWATVAAIVLVFFLTLQAFALVPVMFFPEGDRPTFTAELRLPVGSSLDTTDRAAAEVERFLRAEMLVDADAIAKGEEGVTNWAVFMGEGAPRFILPMFPEQTTPEYAVFIINATSREVIDELVPILRRFCFDTFPDLKAQIDPLPLGPPIINPIEIRISGRVEDVIFGLVETVKARLHSLAGPTGISDDWGARAKKLMVHIDEARAQRAGVSNLDIAISLQTALTGFDTTEFREDDKVIPVTLRSVAADRKDLGKLESLNVFSQVTGRSVPLEQVADIEVAWEPANIRRRNRLKTVTVQSDLEPGVTALEIINQLTPWLDEQQSRWALGYSWELGGEYETSIDANRSIMVKLPVAAMIIVLLLVGQFNSIRRPAIILITIPFGIIGVIIGLIVMRSYFGFMTLLGIVALSGIVINNAIVLLDRIKIEIEDNGLDPRQAVVESAQRRMRPILLTTVTTLGGLLPLYLGGGSMWEPMAVAIMFGLLFATILTLGVVPVLYSLFFRVNFREFEYSP
jgi:multidrug efflux pump subunit AcrB